MTSDAFSNRHPAVNFLFFLGAIGFAVLIQHPAYLIAGALGVFAFYLPSLFKKKNPRREEQDETSDENREEKP